MNESTKDMAKQVVKKKLLLVLAPYLPGIAIGILMIFVLFVAVLFILGIFEGDGSSGGNKLSYNGQECGFTISTTSLSKSEYKEKLGEYAKKNSEATIFYQHADDIYDLASASNINPELVMVRASVEGYSPGASYNNYWGMGCYNDAGAGACISYGSFLDGVKGYIDNISKYDSLIDMMSKYAYIGDYWVAGDWANGGCIYFEYIKDYYGSSTEAQQSKKNAEAACAAGGTGIKTTQYDQDAYASWQVNSAMADARENIFGLTDKNSLSCPSTNEQGDGINTGSMTHPCPELTYVSSVFGYRTFDNSFHNGIDLAAPAGTPTYAADGGIVTTAGWSNSAGNWVVIDHGNGLVTKYMHHSAIYVTAGQYVSKGQKIGAVGTTGYSSGNHLHFQIEVNDKAVDPRNYVNF